MDDFTPWLYMQHKIECRLFKTKLGSATDVSDIPGIRGSNELSIIKIPVWMHEILKKNIKTY